MPTGWLPDVAPMADAILAGFAVTWASIYAQAGYVRAQARLATATGVWLDGKASDLLGAAWIRRRNEGDASFSLRTRREIVRPRNTRAAIVQVLQDLTGHTATVFRPSDAGDTGGYDTGAMGYDVAGFYGALDQPYQAFVTIQRGTAPGIINAADPSFGIAGYDTPIAGYGAGAIGYGDDSETAGGVTDDDIYRAVASATPAGHINWVRITN